MLAYRLAKSLARAENITTRMEYHHWATLCPDVVGCLPTNPDMAWANEWEGWSVFLDVFDKQDFAEKYEEELRAKLLILGPKLRKKKQGSPYQV